MGGEDAQQLTERLRDLEDRARRLGLYLTEAGLTKDRTGEVLLHARLRIGDVAFSKRVQDRAADDVDRQVEELGVRLADEDFEETRQRMARNVSAGRDPLDDGDGDEGSGDARP